MNENISEKKIFDVSLDEVYHNEGVMRLLEESSRALGEVNTFASGAAEYDFIVRAIKNIEALTSARIEGTTGNLKDLYAEQALSFERKSQLKLFSAINYKSAMSEAENILQTYSDVSMPLIRHIHKLITENDPATKGAPGKFREKDVVIANSALGDFHPAHYLKITDCMEHYVQEAKERKQMPVILNAAISHYQFEAIHPFEDGNGRTGRMLIVIDLLLGRALRTPMLNLSQYFESHRDEYIQALRSVTLENSYSTWVPFFFRAVKEQSHYNIKLIGEFREIEEADRKVVNAKMHSPAASMVLRHALNNLFITVSDTAQYLRNQRLGSADRTQVARATIARLVTEGVLVKEDLKFGRSIVYAHKRLKDYLLGKIGNNV